jgi:hypothetical protein
MGRRGAMRPHACEMGAVAGAAVRGHRPHHSWGRPGRTAAAEQAAGGEWKARERKRAHKRGALCGCHSGPPLRVGFGGWVAGPLLGGAALRVSRAWPETRLSSTSRRSRSREWVHSVKGSQCGRGAATKAGGALQGREARGWRSVHASNLQRPSGAVGYEQMPGHMLPLYCRTQRITGLSAPPLRRRRRAPPRARGGRGLQRPAPPRPPWAWLAPTKNQMMAWRRAIISAAGRGIPCTKPGGPVCQHRCPRRMKLVTASTGRPIPSLG